MGRFDDEADQILNEGIADPNIQTYFPSQDFSPLQIAPLDKPEMQEVPNPLVLPFPLSITPEHLANAFLELKAVEGQLKVALDNVVLNAERKTLIKKQLKKIEQSIQLLTSVSFELEKLTLAI